MSLIMSLMWETDPERKKEKGGRPKLFPTRATPVKGEERERGWKQAKCIASTTYTLYALSAPSMTSTRMAG